MAEPGVKLSDHLDDVQGLVFAGWGQRFPFAAYLFVQLSPGGARAWLGELLPRITRGSTRDDHALQVAHAMNERREIAAQDVLDGA